MTKSSSVDTASVRPEADFKLEYEKHALRVLPQKSCGELRYVDLDEPRVGVPASGSEFGYGQPCGGGKAQIDVTDDLLISTADDNAIARDCADSIRNAPINEPLVPTDRASLCLLTSASDAEDEGISRKLVLITVDSVAADGTMNLLVTAWSIPR